MRDYAGSWDYRVGDSPRRPDGSFAWSSANFDDHGWSKAERLSFPRTAAGRGFLWLRTRLPGPSLRDAVLLLPSLEQAMEAYLDGRLVSRFGPMEGEAARRFAAKRPLYIPLGDDHAQRTLTLRIYSPHRNVGILGTPRLGSYAPLLITVIKQGLPFVIIASVFIALGCVMLVLYLNQRTESLYLLYGTLCLLMGSFQLSRSLMRAFFFEEPSTWRFIEYGSLVLTVAAVAAFIARLIESALSQFLRWLSWVFLAYFVVGTTLIASGAVNLEFVWWLFLWLLLVFVLVAITAVVLGAWRGSSDARILASGLILTAALTGYTVLGSLHIIRATFEPRYYVALTFMLTLGFILARRFAFFQKRLTDYSTVLQLSLSSGQDLAPGQHTQLVLAELLRMLQAERALLFLCKAEEDQVALVAGRDAKGNPLVDATAQTEHDQKIVEAVLKKRRPLAYQRTLTLGDGDPVRRQSVMASPLMARGKLLGVLYLEADALRHNFGREDVEILLGLGGHMALTLTATHASVLEQESEQAQRRIVEQEALLQGAARMAQGDLKSSIVVPEGSELAPLATALDDMRKDLLTKIEMLESSHAAVQRLNEDLRFQLNQRLRRLMDLSAQESESVEVRRNVGHLAQGERLGENYRVVTLLAEGASGCVYEVVRLTDGRKLAAKVLTKQSDRTVTVRFAREAQILASLTHPNVVSIVDVDITPGGVIFLIMELVRGVPLSSCRERYGSRTFALTVLRQLAAGLRALHEFGIVHRDIKPANVLIVDNESQPLVKLVDFGISMLASGMGEGRHSGSIPGLANFAEEQANSADALTGTGVLVGTPMYLAPELYEGSRRARAHSDIFSLGVIGYELLSREMPFNQPPVVARWRQESLNIPSLRTRCPELPTALIDLIDRCLHVDPANRPTAEQIMKILNGLGS